MKRGTDRNDKTAFSGKGCGRITREDVTSKDEISSGWGGRIFASLLRVGKIIYGLWFKPWPYEFCGQLDIEYLCYCPRPKLGKLVFSLWGLSSKSSLYHTSLAGAYNHDTIWVKELSSWNPPPKKTKQKNKQNNSGPTKPLSYENITKLELVVWREYSEIIGFEYCGSVSLSKVT